MRTLLVSTVLAFSIVLGPVMAHKVIQAKATEPLYSVVLIMQSGDEYALDYDLTLDQCSMRVIDLFGGEVKGVECVQQ